MVPQHNVKGTRYDLIAGIQVRPEEKCMQIVGNMKNLRDYLLLRFCPPYLLQ